MHTFIQCVEECFLRDKNNAGLKPGIEITLLSFAWHARSAWFTALTNIFSVAMAFFTRGFSFSLAFFFSARLATLSSMACRSASRLAHAFSDVLINYASFNWLFNITANFAQHRWSWASTSEIAVPLRPARADVRYGANKYRHCAAYRS